MSAGERSLAVPIQHAINRILVAQEEGVIPRNPLSFYDESLGLIFDRSNHIERSIDEKKALRRLYGKTIEVLQDPRETGANATSIFETLCDHTFDPGALRDVSCIVPVGEEKKPTRYEAPGVPIHSRASLIGNVLEHINEGAQKVEVGLVDLSDLRGADSPIVGQKYNPGDVLINKSVSAIRRAINNVWNSDPELRKSLGKQNPNHTYEVGRYGGDEFIFALIGTHTEAQRQTIVMEIQKTLAEEKGYYKKIQVKTIPEEEGGGLKKVEIWEERSIGLKKVSGESVVEWITLPENADEKKLFIGYFERGLLLNNSELKRIISK